LDRNEIRAHIWKVAETGGLLTACSWCGCVLVRGMWVVAPPGVLLTIDEPMTLSHSICPRCAAGVGHAVPRAEQSARDTERRPA
jgi:hypothetical protein